MQGRRKAQQDALCVGESLEHGYRLFGVYDGHGGLGGGRCSRLASTQLKVLLKEKLAVAIKKGDTGPESLSTLVKETFCELDAWLKTLPRHEEVRRSSLMRAIMPPKSADFDQSGSCACVVLSAPEFLLVANLGDSRAILSDGKRITNDHNTMSVKEIERVYEAGGWVERGRVFGVLAPTRAFGDFLMKSPNGELLPVTCVPEIHIIPKTHNMPKYLVLMCDGITNVLSDKELADFCVAFPKLHPSDLAECIVGEAFKRRSKDNLSVIVLRTNEVSSGSNQSISSLGFDDKLASTSGDETEAQDSSSND